MYFFQGGVLLSRYNAKNVVANLRTFGVFFTGSNNAVVYRSCKILRMYPIRCLHIYTASTAYTVYTAIIAYTAYSVAYIP